MNSNPVDNILSFLNLPQYANGSPTEINDSDKTAYEMLKFLEKMPGGFFIYRADEEERILYINKAVLRIFGCDTVEEFYDITNGTFKGFVYHEDLENVENSIREQIENSIYELDYVEYRIVCKDGSIRWVEDYGHFIHSDKVGDIFYVFISDATEKRKRRLKEKSKLLRETQKKEQRLKKIINEYDKELLMINQEHLRRLGVIEGLSANYETILYVDLNSDKIVPYRLSIRTELIFEKNLRQRSFSCYTNNYINTWVHPDDRDYLRKHTDPDYIRKKIRDSKTYSINYRAVKDGVIQYLQLRIVNVSGDGSTSQVVMGYRKVDEEIQREMEQKKVLEDALNNAKHANTVKNTFLSNMSHDMKTPLNAIFGYTSLAKSHIRSDETAREYLDKIDAAGKQLLDLIDKVLEISWIESNDISLTETECSIEDVIRDVYNTIQPQATEKDINVLIRGEHPTDDCVYCDRDKLRQVLLYLANNAVKYTKNGGRVELSVSETEKLPNSYAVYKFKVRDTGIGISSEFMERIFEPFEREKNTTFSGVFGTGLGLTIARNIVEILGGTIDVESEVEKGSTFTVTFKFRLTESSAPEEISQENAIASLLNSKILLVEDNEINLEIETEILGELGFTVDTAENGKIAVDKIKNSAEGEYALVLMDIQMPVMDGRKATEEIRRLENPALSCIPIIALSANALSSDKQLSIECGMNAHLAKPLDIPILLETMAKTVRRTQP